MPFLLVAITVQIKTNKTRTAWAVFRNCGTRLYPQEGLKIRLKT
jgi:hypothetical protein